MKSLPVISILTALLLAGCGEKSSTPEPTTNAPAASGGSVLTSPVDYLNTAVKQQKDAVKTIDTTSLNKAIELFQVQEGRLPTNLNELVTKKYIPLIPTPPAGTELLYNSTKGTVSVEKL